MYPIDKNELDWSYAELTSIELAELFACIDVERDGHALNLSNNQLATLPEIPHNLAGLTKLDLSSNQLTSLPESLGNLHGLRELRLSENQLTNLPESFGNLIDLWNVQLDGNRLSVLPNSIGNLAELSYFLLFDNELTSLPESFGNLRGLTTLHLSFNQLTSLPESFGKLSNLQNLHLSDNQLTSLPESFGNISWVSGNITDRSTDRSVKTSFVSNELCILDLSDNQITNLPDSCRHLDVIHLILNNNLVTDLSVFQNSFVDAVEFCDCVLAPEYLTKFSEWRAEWLLIEDNVELKRVLIQNLGYERICNELILDTIDRDRDYTLLKLDNIQSVYADSRSEIY